MKLRFSIRDLLWLTLVVALIVGWWFDRQQNYPRWSLTLTDKDEFVVHDHKTGKVTPVKDATSLIWLRVDAAQQK